MDQAGVAFDHARRGGECVEADRAQRAEAGEMGEERGTRRDRPDIERPVEDEIGPPQAVGLVARLHIVDARQAEGLHRAVVHVPQDRQQGAEDQHGRRQQEGREQGHWNDGQPPPVRGEHLAVEIGARNDRDQVGEGEDRDRSDQQGDRALSGRGRQGDGDCRPEPDEEGSEERSAPEEESVEARAADRAGIVAQLPVEEVLVCEVRCRGRHQTLLPFAGG